MKENQKNSDSDSVATRAAKAAAAKAAASARRNAYKSVVARTRPTGFLDFIREHGVAGLAIGLVLGTQVKTLVDQFLISFANPVLGLVLPGAGDLSQKKVTLTITELDEKTAVFAWGQFAYVMLSFLIVLMIVYYVFKFLRLNKLKKPS